ncbi:MAG: hypothetical protein J6D21_01320 [Clostridia bacterium]|nr:hypothetical protein [Clostridia bacterium]
MRSTFAKFKNQIRSAARVLLNPRLVLCFALAWMVTNGWCYIAIILGTWLKLSWMAWAGTAYASFLWLPFTPEKIVTILLSIALLRLLFPNDEQTLKLLKDKLANLKAAVRHRKAHKQKRKRT